MNIEVKNPYPYIKDFSNNAAGITVDEILSDIRKSVRMVERLSEVSDQARPNPVRDAGLLYFNTKDYEDEDGPIQKVLDTSTPWPSINGVQVKHSKVVERGSAYAFDRKFIQKMFRPYGFDLPYFTGYSTDHADATGR